jgi:hypothetical protein
MTHKSNQKGLFIKGLGFIKSNKSMLPPDGFQRQAAENYAWFPITGNSMSDGTPRSIVDGSFVLCRELETIDILGVPLYVPICIHALDQQGNHFSVLKTVCFIDGVYDRLLLRSYNPSSDYKDWWIPFRCITKLFVVEFVRLPNGRDFKPNNKQS